MERTRGSMDMFKEFPQNSRRRQAPRPLPLPLIALDQLLATQNALMQRLVANEQPHQHHQHEMSYSDFLATHPPMFTEVVDPLEAGSWLHTTEAKFDLIHCSETQKTLFVAQQLHGSVSALWETFTATLPDGY
jgi:hypothetical protein